MIYEPRVLTMLFHWTITVAVSHLFIDIPVSIMTKLVAWFLMSSKTTNQTQPFKPRIFPTPALTELALCLPQLLHLAYDGKLQSGLFVLCVGVFFLFCFLFCKLFPFINVPPEIMRKLQPKPSKRGCWPLGVPGYSKGLRNLKELNFPIGFSVSTCSTFVSRIDLQENTPAVLSPECSFQSCSFPILQRLISLWCSVSQDNLKEVFAHWDTPSSPSHETHTGTKFFSWGNKLSVFFMLCNSNYPWFYKLLVNKNVLTHRGKQLTQLYIVSHVRDMVDLETVTPSEASQEEKDILDVNINIYICGI